MSVLYLKAFDLDLPYIIDDENVESIMKEENCEYDDEDYELNWKWKRRSFSLETRCITAMFERLIGKQKTKDCWKILVDCVMNGIEKLVLDKNWDITPFKETALKIEELGYVNEWVWKKVIKSPKKNYSAKVIC